MTVKLIVLKSGEDIIADMSEMVVGEGDDKKVIGYFLNRACGISLSNEILKTDDADTDSYKLKLFPWCPLTKEEIGYKTTDKIRKMWLLNPHDHHMLYVRDNGSFYGFTHMKLSLIHI